ncbi:MAG: NosD domain-containing protein [Steroidobacteraceae bacterium]
MFFQRSSIVILSVLASLSAGAETIVVKDTQSIQAAIKKAHPGDTVQVMPGLYKETVYIDKDNIRLTGVIDHGQWPVMDGENTRSDGVLVSGHGVTVENLHIKRYIGNGIMTQGANNFSLLHNWVEGPGFYGIFPQFGQNGLVAYNYVSEIVGTGIYIGMSQHIDVLHNDTRANSAFGIEAENSDHILIEDNYTHENEIGIVVNLIPGLVTKKSENIVIRNNFVTNNTLTESGYDGRTDSGKPAIDNGTGMHPEGTGILINGGDSNTIEGNFLVGNPGAGIFVQDHLFGQMFPFPDSKIDPYPDDNKVLSNVFVDNGKHPTGRTLRLLQSLKRTEAPDLVMAGRGRRNCMSGKETINSIGAEAWTECPTDASSKELLTMRLDKPIPTPSLTLEQKGRLTYLAVCTGCHSYTTRIAGPPMIAARAPYMGGDPQTLADWISHPTKKRADYPTMPPQNYLPDDVRLEVSKYVLSINEPQ